MGSQQLDPRSSERFIFWLTNLQQNQQGPGEFDVSRFQVVLRNNQNQRLTWTKCLSRIWYIRALTTEVSQKRAEPSGIDMQAPLGPFLLQATLRRSFLACHTCGRGCSGEHTSLSACSCAAGFPEGDVGSEATGADDAVHRLHLHSAARSLLYHVLHDRVRPRYPSQRHLLPRRPGDAARGERRHQPVHLLGALAEPLQEEDGQFPGWPVRGQQCVPEGLFRLPETDKQQG